MGTVVVFDTDKVLELFNSGITGGVIDANGDLILQRPDGTSVNLGNVKSHSQLTNLDEDDHPQYALADGSRGEFATKSQGLKADAALPKMGATVDLNGADGTVETITITDDGTSTGNWLNRWMVKWKESSAVGALVRTVFGLNEYGEIRIASAKHNTTGLRVLVKEFPTNPVQARDMTVPVMEIMDDRTNRNSLRSWFGDGSQARNGNKLADVMILVGAAPVPAGTAANTLIVRI